MASRRGGGHKKFKEKSHKYEDKPDKQVDFPVRLCMWYFDQCDPKKCSGMILKKHGLLSTLTKQAKFSGIVLTPTATKMVSPEDKEIIQTAGVCVIDCSWQFFDSVKVKSIKKNERLLPYMLAANPVNYGKEIKLTCAEALAGALYLSGFQEEAEQVMDCFKWGGAFFFLNEIYFEKYVKAQTSDEMMIAQEEMLKELDELREQNRNREIEMPSSSSDEEEDEDEEQDLQQNQRNGDMPSSSSEEDEDHEEEQKQEEEERKDYEKDDSNQNEKQLVNVESQITQQVQDDDTKETVDIQQKFEYLSLQSKEKDDQTQEVQQ